jgi:CheY-like chemotaxis protein
MQSSWPSLTGQAILIVDDHDDTRELLQAILTTYGAQVMTAASVRDARILLDQSRPDILITDLAMPGEDGFSLMEHCRHHTKPELRALPIVALTAYGTPQVEERVLAAGFDAYLAKPVEPRQVGDVVRDLILRKSSSAL